MMMDGEFLKTSCGSPNYAAPEVISENCTPDPKWTSGVVVSFCTLSFVELGNPHDQLAIAYNLIVDNKRIEDETSKLDIKNFYVASSPPPPSMMLDSPLRPPSSTGCRQRRLSGGNVLEKSKTTPIKRAKWHLGIRSQSKAQDIMNEVYRAMKALNFVSSRFSF
ncbi:unnamed protein product [Sphagnum jensenii]|uniref:non-specific serine/threonine protein kinase n=1 Tax=Sphagnum jensenii TaxID=128206 RepID=A0ABP0VDV2_9BRYO